MVAGTENSYLGQDIFVFDRGTQSYFIKQVFDLFLCTSKSKAQTNECDNNNNMNLHLLRAFYVKIINNLSQLIRQVLLLCHFEDETFGLKNAAKLVRIILS